MATPRSVLPGRILVICRKCTQRQFLLRPDDETNQIFMYCLAEAAKRFGIQIILSQMEANHHHTVLWDPDGREVEFREHFHKMFAKCQNAHLGRSENLWSSLDPSVMEVGDREALLEQLVYVATNPVKDHLVERVFQWPGPNFVQALLTGKPIRVRRPRHFFRNGGDMPAEVTLELKLPDHIEDKAGLLAELKLRIAAVEDALILERAKTGRRVFGRRRARLQSWRASPTSKEPRRVLNPRVVAKDPVRRKHMLTKNAEWRADYRQARKDLLAEVDTTFPYGTYWLRKFAGVPVRPRDLTDS